MEKILITGATGFVGRKLCEVLKARGYFVRGAIRSNAAVSDCITGKQISFLLDDVVVVGDIGPQTDWDQSLKGIDVVIHLAARVHIMQEMSSDPALAFRLVNVMGTEKVAKMAAKSGVKRFIYISSISIHGNSTDSKAYIENDKPSPYGPYALSKWEAEVSLQRISKETGLDLVIVRPPLVYGPGVGGNFFMLMRWIDRGLPLPMGSVHNLRSFVGIENLVDLIVLCVTSQQAKGETFLVSDGEDLSTPDLIRRAAKMLGKRARLISVPVGLMRGVAKLIGKEDVLNRLCNYLQVNSDKARNLLGWYPQVPLDEGLLKTARWYRQRYGN